MYVPEVQLPLKSNFLRRVVFVATEKLFRGYVKLQGVYVYIYIHIIYIYIYT